jgi:hypothetical protein
VEKLGRAKRVWEQDEQLALVGLLPDLQQALLRCLQLFVVLGHRCQSHGQFMRVCADRFQVVLIRVIGIRRSGKTAAEHIAHGFHWNRECRARIR